jgi:hypothetical protein
MHNQIDLKIKRTKKSGAWSGAATTPCCGAAADAKIKQAFTQQTTTRDTQCAIPNVVQKLYRHLAWQHGARLA